MEEILEKINLAYQKGINDPRFKDAIEFIKEKEEKVNGENLE